MSKYLNLEGLQTLCKNLPIISGNGTGSAILKTRGASATGTYSVSLGQYTQTLNDGEVAFGKYNKSISGSTLFTIGNGTASERSNILTIDVDGNVGIGALYEQVPEKLCVEGNIMADGTIRGSILQAINGQTSNVMRLNNAYWKYVKSSNNSEYQGFLFGSDTDCLMKLYNTGETRFSGMAHFDNNIHLCKNGSNAGGAIYFGDDADDPGGYKYVYIAELNDDDLNIFASNNVFVDAENGIIKLTHNDGLFSNGNDVIDSGNIGRYKAGDSNKLNGKTADEYALKTDIPTSLPASDVQAWAKATSKPTYTFAEITNKIIDGNEFNFVPKGYNGAVHINHKPSDGKVGEATISEYIFKNGNNSSAKLVAGGYKVNGGTSSQLLKADGEVAAIGFWDAIPSVNDAGVMEIGRYIDFHYQKTDTSDYGVRLKCPNDASLAAVSLPSKTGTLALTSDGAPYVLGTYTGSGGGQYPKYVDGGTVRWNMMRNTTTYFDQNLYGASYCDWMLMDTYTGSDVPYVTGIGVLKGDATRAFIMSGAKGTNNKWKIKELSTTDHTHNINVGVTSITPGTGLTGTTSDVAITSTGTINLKTASTSEIGGIKVGKVNTSSVSCSSDGTNYYAVNIDSTGKGYVALPAMGGSNYYHTPSYTSGLKIGVGTGVNDLYVPLAAKNTSGVVSTGAQTFTGNKTFEGSIKIGNMATLDIDGSALRIDKELKLTAGGSADICQGIACALKADRLQVKNLISENIILGSSNTGTQSNMAFNIKKYESVSSQAPASLKTLFTIDTSGSVTVQDIVTASAFYMNSDERLKTFGEPLKVDFEKLSNLRKSYFTFNENPDKNHIGVSAQEIKEIYPEIVNESEDGYLSVDYSKLAVVALVAVDELHRKNVELEKRLARIEALLDKINID